MYDIIRPQADLSKFFVLVKLFGSELSVAKVRSKGFDKIKGRGPSQMKLCLDGILEVAVSR